jgi:hypothetical protein
VGPSWQPPTTRDEEEECVTFTGVRTREERDAEGRKNAVSLDEDEAHVSSAEAASVKVKAETVAAEAPAAAAGSEAASGGPGLPPGYYPLDGPPPPGYEFLVPSGGVPPASATPTPSAPVN